MGTATNNMPSSSPTITKTWTTPWYKTNRAKRVYHAILVYALMIPLATMFTIPFFWMVATALKDPKHIFDYPPQWIPNPAHWENFPDAWSRFVDFNLYLKNTLFITLMNVTGNLFSCSLAAFAFARLRARGKNILFLMVLGTMMIPMWVTLIPQYVVFAELGWTNTFRPLIIPAWFGWPFFIFLLRQFFLTIPRDLEDAARIDGATTLGIFWRIFVPLSKPALATVAVLAFIGNWNNFMGPLIYLRDPEKYTMALAVRQFQGQYGTFYYHYMMAVATIMVIPVIIIFFFAQRYLIRGIVMSGMKG